jgi:hypothetical protein
MWLGPESDFDNCPEKCCFYDPECSFQMGMHGFTVPINVEYMLIFGGMTARDLTFNASGTDSDPNEK